MLIRGKKIKQVNNLIIWEAIGHDNKPYYKITDKYNKDIIVMMYDYDKFNKAVQYCKDNGIKGTVGYPKGRLRITEEDKLTKQYWFRFTENQYHNMIDTKFKETIYKITENKDNIIKVQDFVRGL